MAKKTENEWVGIQIEIQMKLAQAIKPYVRTPEGIADCLYGLAWNMVCLLTAADMSRSDMMEAISHAINEAASGLPKGQMACEEKT